MAYTSVAHMIVTVHADGVFKINVIEVLILWSERRASNHSKLKLRGSGVYSFDL